MKIIQLCPKLNQGGVERGVIELANYLSCKKSENYICSFGGTMLEELNDDTIHFTLPIHKKTPISIIRNALKLAKFVKHNQIEVIHAHSRAPAWVGLIAAKLSGAKYVTTYHGVYSSENIFKRAYSYPMRAGKQVAYVSDYIKKHLLETFNMDESKLVAAYRCFDHKQFSMDNIDENELLDLKQKYKLDEVSNVLCLVGRFSYIKGQIELLHALKAVKNQDWKLLLVGSGDDKITNEIIALIEKYNMQDKVILTGAQKNPELYYAASDICFSVRITPEAFGRVPLEAQAMEKIVIATKHGGHLETVKNSETGFFVDPNNLQNWVEVIDHSLNLDPIVRKKMGHNALGWVTSKYTLEKMCQSEISMYK